MAHVEVGAKIMTPPEPEVEILLTPTTASVSFE
jgi:hypothetical protein